MTHSGIPQILLQAGLVTHLLDPSSIRELRQLKHPIFPDNQEVTGPNNEHWLRMQDVVTTEQQLTRHSYLIRLFVELSRQPTFLKFQGFTVRRQPQGYEVSILLEYGGISFDRQMKKRKNRENYIVTEQELWECLLCIVNSLYFLRTLGIQRHGHIMFYSIRKIRNAIKLLYNPQMHTCYELAKHQAIEYYKLFLSPEQLAALKNQSQNLSFASDIFSLGMMVLNMATIIDLDNVCYVRRGIKQCCLDYDNINRKMAYVASYYSNNLLQLLAEMLREDPRQRPGLADLLERIRRIMKENSSRRDRCMEQLLQHHESAGISSIKYEFSADEQTIKKEIDKMKKSRSKSKKKEQGFRIDFRGTFGQKPESPRKPMVLHSKTTVEIRTDEEEKEQQVPKMYQEKKASKKIQSMALKKNGESGKKLSQAKEDKPSVEKGVQSKNGEQGIATTQIQLSHQPLQTDSHSPQPIKIQQLPDTDMVQRQTPSKPSQLVKQAPSPVSAVSPPAASLPPPMSPPHVSVPPPSSALKQSLQQTVKKGIPRFASVPEANIEYVHPKQIKNPSNLVESPIKTQMSQASQSYFQFPIKSPRSSSPSSSPQKVRPLEELVKQFVNPGIFINGNVYYGMILNGRRNGKGLEVFPGGQYYYGHFEDDLFHGEGLYFWSSQQYFQGTFKRGSKAQGKMVVAGRYYVGQFKDNKRHGKGKAIYGKQIYEGEWKNGRKDGEGKMVYADGEIFQGRWQQGLKNGPGSLQSKAFQINGEWLKDQLHGHCQIVYRNGDIYRGHYVESQRTGEGQYYFSKGSRFKGMFQDDKMIKGTIFYSDGTIYEGGVSADAKRHGRGKYTYGHGQIYEGQWSRNQKHGYGRISTQDYIYEGQWQQGMKHGQGILVDNRTGITSRVTFQHDNLKT